MTKSCIPPLDGFIAALRDETAEGGAYPAGGAVAAVVAGLAASLAAAAADLSRVEWDEAAGARAQAQALRRRAVRLAERDAAVYDEARQLLNERRVETDPGEPPADPAARSRRLGVALERAAGPPLELAASAADIAELARVIVARGSEDVRADAMIASMLAAAAARAAARLVQINLVVGTDKPLAEHARECADAAAAAAASAVELAV